MNLRAERLEEINKGISRFKTFLSLLQSSSRKLSWYRLFLFITEVIIFLLLFFIYSGTAAYISLAVFLIIFGFLVQQHNKVDFCIRKTNLWIMLKENNAARVSINWDKIPVPPSVDSDETHPFDEDLNITGKHSLMHLVNLSVSKEGTAQLHKWLTCYEPVPDELKVRQSTIKELIPLNRFRDKLQLNSGLTYNASKENRLAEQLKPAANISSLKKILTSLYIVVPVNIILFLLFFFMQLPPFFTIGLLAQLAIYWFNLNKISDLYDRAVNLEEDLGKFSRVFEFIENYSYAKNSELKRLCNIFLQNEFKPSYKLKQIKRTVLALGFQKNPLTQLILNIFFPWDFYHAYRLERFKVEISGRLPEWLNTWYKLEALISLANLGYIYPDYTFPDIITNEHTPIFKGSNMGHPLIPDTHNVTNNFEFTKKGECAIITGSNMSGKSTFLRTLGLNLALAYSGAPVYASELKTPLFRIFTCIKVSDSVTDGISFFYAEVKRLKKLLNELKIINNYPLFFLIDEIFRGTNNLERLIGSRSYIKELAGSNGIGLISTHDLELVKLEKEINNINNYHFKEEVAGDRMIFDYKIHPGPCPTTNALKIMKMEGLPVDPRE